MSFSFLRSATVVAAAAHAANAYWLMAADANLVSQRMDPIVSPNAVSAHTHTFVGGSNIDFNLTTAKLQESECTTMPVKEDNSVYWFPHLYYQWANGSFTSLGGSAVIYYLFDNNAESEGVTAFPDDFRMISGNPTLRSYNASSYAQQAVTFLCIAEDGSTTRYNQLPPTECPFSMRAQINFPMCWNGVDVDSANHQSHVAFPSGGPDSGTCNDPNFPVTLPRIFMEVYWSTSGYDWSQAMNTSQPFVYAMGDSTGYGYHADFFNGWKDGALQKAVNGCNCNEYGDPTCCGDAGIFTYETGGSCEVTSAIDETVLGEMDTLPGNNPVVGFGPPATILADLDIPAILSPVFVLVNGSTATGSATILRAATSILSGAETIVTSAAAALTSALGNVTSAIGGTGAAATSTSVAAAATTSAAIVAATTPVATIATTAATTATTSSSFATSFSSEAVASASPIAGFVAGSSSSSDEESASTTATATASRSATSSEATCQDRPTTDSSTQKRKKWSSSNSSSNAISKAKRQHSKQRLGRSHGGAALGESTF